MIKKIKNNTGSDKTWVGALIHAGEYYQIQSFEMERWASNAEVIAAIATHQAIVNDGISDITDVSDAVDFLVNGSPRKVITAMELNNKDLKMACARADVDPETYKATIKVQVPGAFGSGNGRYVVGGYGYTDSFRPDDRFKVWIEDKDRLIAEVIKNSLSLPSAPSDEEIQGMGEIPGVGSYPNYPVIKFYIDEELPEENRGWHFEPLSRGGTQEAVGYCEVEPIGGYAFIPAGFYLVTELIRSINSGTINIDIFWGKLG